MNIRSGKRAGGLSIRAISRSVLATEKLSSVRPMKTSNFSLATSIPTYRLV
jgi:hypothetical protein